MNNDSRWVGTVRCSLTPNHSGYADGFRGAYIVFACAANGAASCMAMLEKELAENELMIVGFESLNESYAEREPSEYEQALLERLDTYPVQFENVHLYKSDA